MRKKQDLKGGQRAATTSIAPSTSEALEQQVREHPVVQEVIRLFDARIVAIMRAGASEVDEHSVVEQQMFCFTSQEL
jgi:hypothetical protein